MAYYDALIAKWGTLSGTTAQKLAAINSATVQTAAQGTAVVTPSQVLNAIVFADLAALTQLQVAQLTLLLSGSMIDASKGSSIRTGIQALFAGKATTLANLAALVAPADTPLLMPWWKVPVAQGGGGLNYPVLDSDLTAAGGLT